MDRKQRRDRRVTWVVLTIGVAALGLCIGAGGLGLVGRAYSQHYAGRIPAGEGKVWDSSTVRSLVAGRFVPYIYVGGPERGICFAADNDRDWVRSDGVPMMEIDRAGDVVNLRLNLIATLIFSVSGLRPQFAFCEPFSTSSPEPSFRPSQTAKAILMNSPGVTCTSSSSCPVVKFLENTTFHVPLA